MLLVGVVLITVLVTMRRNNSSNMNENYVGGDDLEKSVFSNENLNSIDGVYFANVDYLPDSELFRCTLANNTDSKIHYGEQFFLERYIEGEWYEIPYSYKIPWSYQLNYLVPFSREEIDIPVGIWEPVSDGVYRLVKEVSLNEGGDGPYYVSSSDFAIKN